MIATVTRSAMTAVMMVVSGAITDRADGKNWRPEMGGKTAGAESAA